MMHRLSGALIGFCFALTAAGSTPVQVEVRSGALQLRLSVSRAEYHVGQDVPLLFSLRNAGEAPAVIRSFAPSFFDFAVYDASGVLVRKPTLASRPILAPPRAGVLQPGETITATLTWQPWMLDAMGRRVPVPSGSYSLEGYALWDRGGAPLLRTPRLSIEIRADRSGNGEELGAVLEAQWRVVRRSLVRHRDGCRDRDEAMASAYASDTCSV